MTFISILGDLLLMGPIVVDLTAGTGSPGMMESDNVSHLGNFMMVDCPTTGGALRLISLATASHTSGQQGTDNVIASSIKVWKQFPCCRRTKEIC